MAYDWSGNTVKQKRDDRMVVMAVVALVLFMTIAPIRLMRVVQPSPHVIDTMAISIGPSLAKM
ncbi:hypothetical protein [Agrobacterium rubi]|uniref:Uncharacterized protein n=1 Tax=Agrobacterium rubi TaxID=28099 RepID=A0AAE7R6J7_9HYPH|nr:hypothetical protein [Agrobacterium rubi]NTE89252.1 hypothetical protein [Agrobacterium rubi]NTF05034.1 hypothetical protein [Agrobacterium rubi]NTF38804.1 hypothetical protein [Agrobacterium rubi]QTF99871.1 hypothetical protein G6M88_05430 [Agrobacterium rubi]